ncbi:hypothetical protein POV26_04335 [Aequorivita todarodis]|uniref:hypothetical protein n=1 Tax=Aequorivita todarodis TaxID=2036821 RepID=UPI0023500F8E|nr:hypothetical protein [Aequorivita todarodis]MDC8000250.1 hypothetical protein [Aequorivita todarodis]
MVLDICITVIVFLVGFNLKNWFGGFSSFEKSVLNKLFFYHMIIGVAFHFYAVEYGADAIAYWDVPKEISLPEVFEIIKNGSASGIIYLINYFPSNTLNLSFFVGNMCYSLFGFIGFIYLFKIIKDLFNNLNTLNEIRIFGIPILPWIWFLPNFHFWSSGIGKDTLLFTAIVLFLYAFQNIRKRLVILLISILLSFAIRPHILLFLLVSFAIGYILDGNLKGYQKAILFILLLIGFASIFRYVLGFIQLETLDINSVEDYVSKKASGLNQADSGSGIDTSGYPFPYKIFTFLYRPLFFDSPNSLGILSSIENCILLVFTLKVLFNKPFKGLRKSNYLIKSNLIYFLISAAAFALILGNLGIMLRQKNMIIPSLIIVGYSILYINHQRKNKINESTSTYK